MGHDALHHVIVHSVLDDVEKLRVHQLQDEYRVPVEIFECVDNAAPFMEASHLLLPAFADIARHDLVKEIRQRVLLRLIIMIKGHPGHTGPLYDVRHLDFLIFLLVHQGENRLADAHAGETGSFIVILGK